MKETLDLEKYALKLGQEARAAAAALASASSAKRDAALRAAAGALRSSAGALIFENEKDLAAGRSQELSSALLDRLTLTEKRIDEMAHGLEEIAQLGDPVGEIIKGWRRPNGMLIEKVRVPIGVIFMIYESRPNVTADAAGLCLKSGNACILRGGKEAINSSTAIARILRSAIASVGLPEASVQIVETTDRALVGHLLQLGKYIDVAIPRGGKGLVKRVIEESKIPVLKHYEGICHTYVDASADLKMASDICFNAKVQRAAVCNAMETMLVHEAVAKRFLPDMCRRFEEARVELRGDEASRAAYPSVKTASEEDWSTEYLDLILSIKVVKDVGEAINHIRQYGSAHSDAIVANDHRAIERFVNEVDSSAVFVNASTRLNDGTQFGFGAEVGISTDKLHSRGPMGLEDLTIYKYVVYGQGQLRQ